MTFEEALPFAIASVAQQAEAWGADMEKIQSGEDYRVKIAAQAIVDFVDTNKRVERDW